MLEDIGFYTLCDERCENLSADSPMWRCEMILTERCNFKCPYCRGLRDDCKGDMPYGDAIDVLNQWISQGLKNVRFSGGEPTVYPKLIDLVKHCVSHNVRVAISTNGAASRDYYQKLVDAGVTDFSISLDACCSADGGRMAGTSETVWERVVSNIRYLAKLVYVTVGVVLTEDNVDKLCGIVKFAHDLGVADIRIISAAQFNRVLVEAEKIPKEILDSHPILKYRVENMLAGRNVRGLEYYDNNRCFLPIDDSVVCGGFHFPCVIYMREKGEPIGKVGPNMRAERILWALKHDTHNDPICRKNCLDVCIDHNNKCFAAFRTYINKVTS